MPSAHRAPIAFPLPEDLSGSRIGRFNILFRIGGGGMGDVYYAEDTRLKRPVALKRVNRRLRNDPEARRHILREAQRASALSSDHIVSVYDVVEEHGELLLVMEYVEGTTLRQRLRACSPLQPEVCMKIATECAEALFDAHRKGIIHRDIKPENIISTATDHVKILDFGLALRLRTGNLNAMTISAETEEFGIAGTPAYMAPEVVLEEETDGRADIFSLGVVLYEALTGQHPFATKTRMSTADQILHHEPPSPSKVIATLPTGFDRIVSRMLAKQPAQRYQNALELLDDLHALAGANGTTSWLDRLRDLKYLSGRKKVSALVGAMLLMAVLAWGVLRIIPYPADSSESGANLSTSSVLIVDFDSLGDPSIPDKAIRELFTTALQQSRRINVLPRSRVYEALQRMKRADVGRIDETIGREICRRENAKVLLAGSIAQFGETLQINISAMDPIAGTPLFTENERVQQKAKVFDAVDALAQRVRNRLGEPKARIEQHSESLAKVTTSSLDALQLYSQGMDLMAQGRCEQAISLFDSATERDPNFAMAHLGLSDCYSSVVGRTSGALREIHLAYDLRANLTERERLQIEAGFYNLQEDYVREAQSLQTLAALYTEDASAHRKLAAAYDNLGRFDDALRELRRGIQLDPNTTTGYVTLVLWLARSDENEAAIRAYETARSRGIESPYLQWGLGMAYLGLENLPKAREQFGLMTHGNATEAELGHFYLAMSDLYAGKLRAAEVSLVARLREKAGSAAGFGSLNHYQLARIRLLQGDPDGAKRHAEAILAMQPTEIQVVDYRDAARALLAAGNLPDAKAVLTTLRGFAQTSPNGWNEASYGFLAGEILSSAGDLDGAQGSFEAALRAFPEPGLHLALGRVFVAKKHWREAVEQYQQFLAEGGNVLQHGFPPDLVIAHLELARAYREVGDTSRAETEYQIVLRMWRDGDSFPLRRQATKESIQMRAGPR